MTSRTRASSRWASKEGLPFPLGATRIEDEQVYNFAIYSKHAESVTLLLYAARDVVNPVLTYRFDYLRNKSGRVWHCRLPVSSMRDACYYAYRVEGPTPNGRFEWHWFDRDKILLDPYAKSVFFPETFDRLAAARPGSNAGQAPLGVLTGDGEHFDWRGDRGPRHEADTVIYELHVGGFTRNPNSAIRADARGTFAGVIEKIPYLTSLGVTVVELMPVFPYDPSDGNFWGYAPLNFFAPHHGYISGQSITAQHNEFRALVKALHEAEIEVVLDVVYNHTGEGDHTGPIFSYKGIDNSTYYLMADRPSAPFENFSGTGNTLNCVNRYVRKMIMDSVRHWAMDMHVDGFRFDLASIFTRDADGSVDPTDAALLSDMASDPHLAHLRLIAEPWDAAGVYQLGRAFPGIMTCQWNGSFRDDIRCFVKGDPGRVPALMRRLYGSDDLFPDDRMNAYRPHQSVNYITSHDGFTLYDLVAYNEKRNWANAHHNSDGPAENYFRKAHPSLARSRFWREEVHWYGVGREPDLSFDSRSLAFALRGASQQDDDLYVMINAYWQELTFEIQEGAAREWRRVMDTSMESPRDFLEPGSETPLESLHYPVPGRSIVTLVRART